MIRPYGLARYICLETHDKYEQGVMYTVEEWGYADDWGTNSEVWKIDGEVINVSKFHRVHHNISQEL